MKNINKILFISILVLITALLSVAPEKVKIVGDTIFATTKAVFASVGINITINTDTTPPTILLESPINTTYNVNHIPLSYSVSEDISSINTIFYTINNNNITITENIILVLGEGTHTLVLYANNSIGLLNSTKVTFSINSSEKYNVEIPSGFEIIGFNSSLNIKNLTKSQQENIENFIIQFPNYGKIKFKDSINLSTNGRFAALINLTAHMSINYSKIMVDSFNLLNFNKSATLTIYNLTYVSPKVLMDNRNCPAIICTNLNYSNNALEFDVSHFTEYSAAEGSSAGSASSSTSPSGRKSRQPTPLSSLIQTPKEACTTEWICSEWSKCNEEIQTRTCSKLEENCVAPNKPIETQSCFQFKDHIKVILNKRIISHKDKLSFLIDLKNIRQVEGGTIVWDYIIKNNLGNMIYYEREIIETSAQEPYRKEIDTSRMSVGKYSLLIQVIYPDNKINYEANDYFIIEDIKIKDDNKKQILISSLLGITLIIIMLFYKIIKTYRNKKKSKRNEEWKSK